jgi:HemY protein
MKWLLLLVIIAVGSVTTALIVLEDPGYVLLSWDVFSVETSLAFFVLALLFAYGLLYSLQRFITRAWGLPDKVQQWQQQRHAGQAHHAYYQGMRELAQGHWQRAEKQLLRHVKYSAVPMLHYLAAAYAAQQQGHQANRDRYLQLAAATEGSDLAVSLTQAKLQISQQQHEQALATLSRLHELEPRNTYVLRLLRQTYLALGDWESLRKLLPVLRKLPGMDEKAIEQLDREVFSGLLETIGKLHKHDALEKLWHELPKHLQEDVSLVKSYADQLRGADADDIAEQVLRKTLKKNWNEALVLRYGLLESDDAARQLKIAEDWIREHGKSANLLLTLGRLCLRNRLWGKARIYFESSISIEPQAVAYRELGLLLEHLGDHDAAMNCYRDGMQLAADTLHIDYPEPQLQPGTNTEST